MPILNGVRLLVLAVLLVLAGQRSGGQAPPRFDLVIAGGQVVDGTGAAGRRADVAIKDGRIAAIGRIPRSPGGATIIDASGLIVAPGFIDVHTHADNLASAPRAENFVRMGVTTIVAGNCGGSALDVGAALARAAATTGVAVNFATLIGHNTVRSAVMGTENRAPRAAELDADEIARRGRRWLTARSGSRPGCSTFPAPTPDQPRSSTSRASRPTRGGIYASHMRNEGTELEAGDRRDASVSAKPRDARVQISHLKVDSPSRWGASARRSR